MTAQGDDAVTKAVEAMEAVPDNAKAQVASAAVEALPDGAKADVAKAAVEALPESATAGVAKAAVEALSESAKADVAKAAVGALSESAKADVARAAVDALPDSAKADVATAAARGLTADAQDKLAERLAPPDQAVTNEIWRWIVRTFAIVLVAATLALAGAVFVSLWREVDTAQIQILLTVFTTVAGILAGFVSGRASTGRVARR